MSSNLNRNTLDFYINNHFIHSLARLLNKSDVSEDDKAYIIDTLYIHYKNCSSLNKDKLIDLFIRYEVVQLFERILFDDSVTYGQIERMCTGIKNCDNYQVKEWLNTNLLSLDVFISENFIINHPTQAAYVFLNTDVSEFEDLNIDNISNITHGDFIGCVALNYEASKHEEWLDYIIVNTHDVLYALWSKNIRFSDAQLKAIDNSNPSIYDNGYIVAVIKSNFTAYVINECTHIISDLYSHGKLSGNEYSIIDLYNINSVTDVLKSGYIHAIDEASYKTSLLKKINDYSLVNIFNYLFGDEYINMSDQNYYLSRDDNDSIIRTALLSHYVDEEALGTINKVSYNCLYMTVFELIIYQPFIDAIVNNTSTYTSEELSHLDSNYSAELAVCTSDENVYTVIVYTLENSMSHTFNNLITVKTIADESLNDLDSSYAEAMVNAISNASRFVSYTIDHQMYNSLSLLIYDKNLTNDDYVFIQPIVNDEFKSALISNIGDSNIKIKSYKLLEHGCYDVFHYLVLNKLSDDDCYDFCCTNAKNAYSVYRSYLLDLFTSEDSYKDYTRNIPMDITGKWSEEEFALINQTVYDDYQSYSTYYNAHLSYYDSASNFVSSYNANRRVVNNVKVLWNILAYLMFNAYNKNGYTVKFVTWATVGFYWMTSVSTYCVGYTHSSSDKSKLQGALQLCDITTLRSCISKLLSLRQYDTRLYAEYKEDGTVTYIDWMSDSIKPVDGGFEYYIYKNTSDDVIRDRIANIANYCYDKRFGDKVLEISSGDSLGYGYNADFQHSASAQYHKPIGVRDHIAYYITEYTYNDFTLDEAFSNQYYSIIAYKLLHSSVWFVPISDNSLYNHVKELINSNAMWKSLTPYVTKGYTCVAKRTEYYNIDKFYEDLSTWEDVLYAAQHNDEVWYSPGVHQPEDYNVALCFIRYTARKLNRSVNSPCPLPSTPNTIPDNVFINDYYHQ